MNFLVADSTLTRIEIQEDMCPQYMYYDGKLYHRAEQEFYDFIFGPVLETVTFPTEERSSVFVYVDVTYVMNDGETIGAEVHFGDGGEGMLENEVTWGYAIFSETNQNGEMAPDYYTGYQITDYFLCMGQAGYCRDQMLQFYEWNSPSPMEPVPLTEKLDAAVMKYLNAGGFPPYDWSPTLEFTVVVQDKEPYNAQLDFAGTYTTEQAGVLFGWIQTNICQTAECQAAYAARPQEFVYAYDASGSTAVCLSNTSIWDLIRTSMIHSGDMPFLHTLACQNVHQLMPWALSTTQKDVMTLQDGRLSMITSAWVNLNFVRQLLWNYGPMFGYLCQKNQLPTAPTAFPKRNMTNLHRSSPCKLTKLQLLKHPCRTWLDSKQLSMMSIPH